MSQEIIDQGILMDIFEGDMELYGEIVEVFLEFQPEQLEAVAQGIAVQDPKAIEQAAHRLKGGLVNIGALQAGEAARVLEEAGRTQQMGGLEEKLKRLRYENKRLIEALKEII